MDEIEARRRRRQIAALEEKIARQGKPCSPSHWLIRYRELNLIKRLRRELEFAGRQKDLW